MSYEVAVTLFINLLFGVFGVISLQRMDRITKIFAAVGWLVICAITLLLSKYHSLEAGAAACLHGLELLLAGLFIGLPLARGEMSRRMTLMVLALFVAILAPATCTFSNMIGGSVATFTPERWQASDPGHRFRYVESLDEQYDLTGMSESQIEELLGPGETATGVPDDGHAYEEYRIKDDPIGGWKVLLFEYDNDTVVSVRETWEDW